jgi:hypothetical protein
MGTTPVLDDASQPPSGTDDDPVEVLIAERDLWRQRANDSEQRWEAFLALEAERAELRRQATETLDRDRLNLLAERDEWQRRASVAESRLAELSPDHADHDALVAERDEWRDRALRAEALIPRDDTDESPPENESEPPSRRHRFRGNWLG